MNPNNPKPEAEKIDPHKEKIAERAHITQQVASGEITREHARHLMSLIGDDTTFTFDTKNEDE
jgi:hypothetical protein